MTIQRKHHRAFFTINQKRKGFTVLELILGLVIFALVGFCLFQMLINGVETYKRAAFSSRTYLQMFKAFDTFDQDFGDMFRFDFSNVDPTWLSFSGDASSMQMVVSAHDGIRVIRYKKVDNGAQVTIKRQSMPLKDFLADRNVQTNGQIVIKNIVNDGFKLSYAKSFPQTPGVKRQLEWQSTWMLPEFPAAVKVEMRLVGFKERQLPIEFTRIYYLENR